MKRYLSYILIIISLLLHSCECVTDIDTEQQIEPEEFTQAILVNAITDNYLIKAESFGITLDSDLNYNTDVFNYAPMPVGNSFVKLSNQEGNVISNTPFEFQSEINYLIVFYGRSFFINSILLENKQFDQKSGANLRLINASIDAGNINFILQKAEQKVINRNINSGNHSNYESLSAGNYVLKVMEEDDTSTIELLSYEIKIEEGATISIILRGFKDLTGAEALNCIFVME